MLQDQSSNQPCGQCAPHPTEDIAMKMKFGFSDREAKTHCLIKLMRIDIFPCWFVFVGCLNCIVTKTKEKEKGMRLINFFFEVFGIGKKSSFVFCFLRIFWLTPRESSVKKCWANNYVKMSSTHYFLERTEVLIEHKSIFLPLCHKITDIQVLFGDLLPLLQVFKVPG